VNIYSIKEKGLVSGSKRRIERGVERGVKGGVKGGVKREVKFGIEMGEKKRKCAGLTGSRAHFSLL